MTCAAFSPWCTENLLLFPRFLRYNGREINWRCSCCEMSLLRLQREPRQSRETFDRSKLLNGLLRACEKRPVSVDTLERIVDEIETLLQNSLDREVSSQRIGTYAMEKLKSVDEVAYVRFASVYRQFKDINSFMEELSKIINSKKE